MSLPLDLEKLPPQSLDVIRYLADQDSAADVASIQAATGLSDRTLGKVIRRLVTRYYIQMPAQGFYSLTQSGREAAQEIRQFAGSRSEAAAAAYFEDDELAAPPGEAAAPQAEAPSTESPVAGMLLHGRRLSVWVAEELVLQSRAMIMAGFDAPGPGPVQLQRPAEVILRLDADGCDIEPAEQPIEVPVNKAVGPLQFRVRPHLEGTVRIRLQVFQKVGAEERLPAGGMFFDLAVSPFPTLRSAEFRALGALVSLHPGP